MTGADELPAGSTGPDRPQGRRCTAGHGVEADERAVRAALRAVAGGVEPRPWPGAAVRGRARRQRRSRLLAVAVPLAAAAVAAGVLLPRALRDPSAGTVVVPAASATAHPRLTASDGSSPAASVLRAAPGVRISTGHGGWLSLTARQVCYGLRGAAPVCDRAAAGNQASDSVSLRIEGGSTGTFYRPLYLGTGSPVRMTLRRGATTFPVRVVALPGAPGYATGYLWGPASAGTGGPPLTVTVYGADGRVLAAMTTQP